MSGRNWKHRRRNRVYRRVAVALTVALLVGQSHAFVLAEESVDVPQTEISSEETGTDAADGGNTDSGNAGDTENSIDQDDENNNEINDENIEDSKNPEEDKDTGDSKELEEDKSTGDQQEDGDKQEQCVCETKCAEETVNTDCPVCAADYAACIGKETEEIPEEIILENALIEEEGIATLAEEDGVEAYADGDEFEDDGTGIKYRIISDNQVEVIGHRDGTKVKVDIVIPESVKRGENVYRVTGIGDNAFYACQSLPNVTIPKSVTSIGKNAFWACGRLNSITIPEGVTSIGDDAFYQCTRLPKVTIPGSVTSMGKYVFSQCTGFREITIQEGVTRIEDGAFGSCSGVSEVTIPKSVTSIGANAFNGCSGLTSVTIPESVTSIEAYAFTKCSSLTHVTIPKSVTDLEWSIFEYCDSLSSVTISENVSKIMVHTFEGCVNLNQLNILVSSEGAVGFSEVKIKAFEGCPSPRQIVFWNADGTEKLTGSVLDSAKLTYLAAPDGDTDDDLWYGWSIDRPITYAVTIHVNLDDAPWTDHGKTFALRKDGDTELITDLAHMSNGTYSIYEVPADALPTMARDTGMDTGVDVIVQDGNAEATINYYTATFYDGAEDYGTDTPQRPQIILSGKQVAEPTSPSKSGHTFTGWKTQDGGNISFNFSATISAKTAIYASWQGTDTPVTTYIITATAGEGGSINPSGNVSVNGGDDRSFAITPNEGWRVKAVTVDGIDRTAELVNAPDGAQAAAGYYTFRNVTANHTIHVDFESDGSTPGGGGDNPNPGGGDDGDNPNPGGGDDGDNPNPGGGDDGDNPNPGGGGDNANPGGGGNGGGNHSGGGNGSGDHSDSNGSGGMENTQVTVVSELSSAPAGNDAAGNTESAQISSGQESRAGDVDVSGGKATANGTSAGTSGQASNGKEPKTGDTTHMEVYATIAMVAGLTYLLLYFMEEGRGMTEHEKDVFVAAFIRWGKKGGAFRKGCAMIAIFCLLAYYHAIGKRAGRNIFNEKYLGQVS